MTPALQAFSVNRNALKPFPSKTILITGGSSGIGLDTAELFFSPSYTVVILDLKTPPPLNLTISEKFLFQKCDVTSWVQQRTAFENSVAKFGHLDAVCVNDGIAEYRDQFFTDDLDAEGRLMHPDRRVYNVDLVAASDTIKLSIHFLRKTATGGSIVVTSSLAGYLASAGAPVYSAAKHGVVGLMRALKNETSKLDIAISVIAPATTISDILPEAKKQSITPREWATHMQGLGLPINEAQTVALGVAHITQLGANGNGMGLLVQGDRFVDLERGLAIARKNWMSQEMLNTFRAGRTTPVISNRL